MLEISGNHLVIRCANRYRSGNRPQLVSWSGNVSVLEKSLWGAQGRHVSGHYCVKFSPQGEWCEGWQKGDKEGTFIYIYIGKIQASLSTCNGEERKEIKMSCSPWKVYIQILPIYARFLQRMDAAMALPYALCFSLLSLFFFLGFFFGLGLGRKYVYIYMYMHMYVCNKEGFSLFFGPIKKLA